MAIQTATTGNLESASNIAIAKARHTMEHKTPCINLIEHMTLAKGQKQLTVPKVGQAEAHDLTDGVDLVTTEDIGLTTTDLTTSEVGLKFILTYKLIQQFNEDVFKMVGEQMGNGMARKKNKDAIALYSALNGGTPFGADDKYMTMANLAACISKARSAPYPDPLAVVHHPNALYDLMKSMAVTPSATYPIPHGYAEDLLKDFYRIKVNGVSVFETGDIAKIGSSDSGYGAIFAKSAMVVIESKGFTKEMEKDISLRAHEVVVTADYGLFELDDSYGAPMRYEIADPATNN